MANRDKTTYNGIVIPDALNANSGDAQVDWLIKLNDPTFKAIIDAHLAGKMKIGNEVVDGTEGSVLFIGADDKLTQNNDEFFWDDTNKKLGIGTKVPSQKLDVNRGIVTGVHSNAIRISETGSNANSSTGIEWYNTEHDWEQGKIEIVRDGSDDSFGMNFYTSLNHVNTLVMTIDKNGNVGVGTDTPSQVLETNGQGFFTGSTAATDPGDASGQGTRIGFNNTGYGYVIAINTGVSTKPLVLQPESNGNIGIKTITPTNTLSFDGNAVRKIWLERHTTANTAGNKLKIQAGGATSAATDKAGGNLELQPGLSTGSAESGVTIQGCPAGGSGTTDGTLEDVIKVLGNKIGVFNTTPLIQQNHIVDADGSLADITTKFNTLLSYLELYGWLKNA